jgi:hypothetical protein
MKKKFLLLFCVMSISVSPLFAQEVKEGEDQTSSILAACPCKDKKKK